MGANPVGQGLSGCGFGKGVVARPQAGHKDLSFLGVSCYRVMYRHRLTTVIYKHLLSPGMRLPHGEVVPNFPLAIATTKLPVAELPALLVEPFLPQQR